VDVVLLRGGEVAVEEGGQALREQEGRAIRQRVVVLMVVVIRGVMVCCGCHVVCGRDVRARSAIGAVSVKVVSGRPLLEGSGTADEQLCRCITRGRGIIEVRHTIRGN
jgi:hypothetical protein